MAKRSREEDASLLSAESSSAPNTSTNTHGRSSCDSLPDRSSKYTELDEESAVVEGKSAVMQCTLPPHKQAVLFDTYDDYDVHYAKIHVNRCVECHKNFPTEHFLQLHIEENHDPLNAVRRARGDKTYRCFVEDCDRVCSAPHKRRLHLIDKHGFPKNYDFFIVNDGIERRTSMLRTWQSRRRSSATSKSSEASQAERKHSFAVQQPAKLSEAPDEEREGQTNTSAAKHEGDGKLEAEVNDLVSSISALKFVPSSVQFGRGRRTGFSRK